MGLEGWRHLDLGDIACDHRSNSCEGLKRFALGIGRPRRVDDDTVPRSKPPHCCLFSVIKLYEASLDPTVHVIPRRDTDPEAARARDGVEFSSEPVVAVDQ